MCRVKSIHQERQWAVVRCIVLGAQRDSERTFICQPRFLSLNSNKRGSMRYICASCTRRLAPCPFLTTLLPSRARVSTGHPQPGQNHSHPRAAHRENGSRRGRDESTEGWSTCLGEDLGVGMCPPHVQACVPPSTRRGWSKILPPRPLSTAQPLKREFDTHLTLHTARTFLEPCRLDVDLQTTPR